MFSPKGIVPGVDGISPGNSHKPLQDPSGMHWFDFF